jgi:hypothetical protein
MKKRDRFVLRLYPRRWRWRYADELEALLDDLPPHRPTTFDLVKGAFAMHLESIVRVPLLTAVAGFVVGTLVYLSAPPLYSSSSTIWVRNAGLADPTSRQSRAMRDALTASMPERLGPGATSVVRLDARADGALVEITHSAKEPADAERVVGVLTTALAEARAGAAATVLSAPSKPDTAHRLRSPGVMAVGGVIGLAFGVVVVRLNRRGDWRRLLKSRPRTRL